MLLQPEARSWCCLVLCCCLRRARSTLAWLAPRVYRLWTESAACVAVACVLLGSESGASASQDYVPHAAAMKGSCQGTAPVAIP